MMTDKVLEKNKNDLIEEMFNAGAHYAYSCSKRHPSMKKFIYGTKSNIEIIDLEKTILTLEDAENFVETFSKEGKKILFVGTKNEARGVIEQAALSIGAPFVQNRWIGGTLTNFEEIKKRVKRLQELTEKKEKGELGMYTKKERLMFDREIADLEKTFGGLLPMADMLPKALFVIDPKKEDIAVKEAQVIGIPVVALANSDCDVKEINYPIPANDSSLASIKLFTERIVNAYKKGVKQAEQKETKPASAQNSGVAKPASAQSSGVAKKEDVSTPSTKTP